MSAWTTTEMGNEVLEGKGFYLSFRAHSQDTAISSLVSPLAAALSGDDSLTDDTAETALCARDLFPDLGNPYFILTGDFRAEYAALIDQGFDACYAFWLTKREEHGNGWSHEPLTDEERAAALAGASK